MAYTTQFIAGISALMAATAGYAVVSRRRRRRKASGLPEAELSDEQRREALALYKALDANATEAPGNGLMR